MKSGQQVEDSFTRKVYKLRLISKKLVIYPVTRIPDPDGDEAKKTGLMKSHWLEVVPCWSRAKLLVSVGTPAVLSGSIGRGLAPGSSLQLPIWPLNS